MEAFRVAVLGSGSFGTVIARIVAVSCKSSPRFDSTVQLYARRQALVDEINEKHTNSQYLGGASLPANIVATSCIKQAVKDAKFVILAVPSEFLEPTLDALRPSLAPDAVVVSLLKGLHFDEKSARIVPASETIAVKLGCEVAALMGPNIYTEMARNEFAEATIGHNGSHGRELKELFTVPGQFAVRLHPDIVGVEMCGALKNVASLAAGYCEGLGYGMNVKVAVIRLSYDEIQQFCKRFFGTDESVLLQACGMGDLILTLLAGRGQQLACAFVKAGGKKDWNILEDELMNGMKLPDWHNAMHMYQILKAHECENEFPLFKTIHAIGFEGAPTESIIACLEEKINMDDIDRTRVCKQRKAAD